MSASLAATIRGSVSKGERRAASVAAGPAAPPSLVDVIQREISRTRVQVQPPAARPRTVTIKDLDDRFMSKVQESGMARAMAEARRRPGIRKEDDQLLKSFLWSRSMPTGFEGDRALTAPNAALRKAKPLDLADGLRRLQSPEGRASMAEEVASFRRRRDEAGARQRALRAQLEGSTSAVGAGVPAPSLGGGIDTRGRSMDQFLPRMIEDEEAARPRDYFGRVNLPETLRQETAREERFGQTGVGQFSRGLDAASEGIQGFTRPATRLVTDRLREAKRLLPDGWGDGLAEFLDMAPAEIVLDVPRIGESLASLAQEALEPGTVPKGRLTQSLLDAMLIGTPLGVADQVTAGAALAKKAGDSDLLQRAQAAARRQVDRLRPGDAGGFDEPLFTAPVDALEGVGRRAPAAEPAPAPVPPRVEPDEPLGGVRAPEPEPGPRGPAAGPVDLDDLDAGARDAATGIEWVDPSTLKVDPAIQFKRKIADKDNMTTKAVRDVDAFVVDPGVSGVVTVWERADGERFIAHGHHRRALALRANRFVETTPDGMKEAPRQIRATVLREADGWTLQKVRVNAAIENLRAGTAEAFEVAMLLSETGITVEQLRAESVSLEGALARNATALSKLDKPTLEWLETMRVREDVAAGIASVDGLTPDQQKTLIQRAENTKKRDFQESRQYAIDYKDSLFEETAQGGLDFGEEFNKRQVDTLDEQNEIITAVQRGVTRDYSELKRGATVKEIEGETIRKADRKKLAERWGSSQANVERKLELMFEKFPDLRAKNKQAALAYKKGEITLDEAIQRIRAEAIRELESAPEKDYITGRERARGDDGGGDSGGAAERADGSGLDGEPEPGAGADAGPGLFDDVEPEAAAPAAARLAESEPAQARVEVDPPARVVEPEPAAKRELPTPYAQSTKPIYDLTPEELDGLRERARAADRATTPQAVLGDRYPEFARLEKSDPAQAEAMLSREERAAIYGDVRQTPENAYFLEDVDRFRRDTAAIREAQSPDELGAAAAKIAAEGPTGGDWTPAQQNALMAVTRQIGRKGWQGDTGRIADAVQAQLGRMGFEAGQAAEIVAPMRAMAPAARAELPAAARMVEPEAPAAALRLGSGEALELEAPTRIYRDKLKNTFKAYQADPNDFGAARDHAWTVAQQFNEPVVIYGSSSYGAGMYAVQPISGRKWAPMMIGREVFVVRPNGEVQYGRVRDFTPEEKAAAGARRRAKEEAEAARRRNDDLGALENQRELLADIERVLETGEGFDGRKATAKQLKGLAADAERIRGEIQRQEELLGVEPAPAVARVEVDPVDDGIEELARAQVERERQTTRVKDRATMADGLKRQMRLGDDEVEAVMALAEARAEGWAKDTGRSADEWYAEHLAAISSYTGRHTREQFQDNKGSVVFEKDGSRAVIYALQSPDVSTAVHELAHIFRRQTPKEIDALVLREIGEKTWNAKAEERFARGFERWLREGKAPTPKLEEAFQKFKEWLKSIYRVLKGGPLDVKIGPQMRATFEGLLDENGFGGRNVQAEVLHNGQRYRLTPNEAGEYAALTEKWTRIPERYRARMEEAKDGPEKAAAMEKLAEAQEAARGALQDFLDDTVFGRSAEEPAAGPKAEVVDELASVEKQIKFAQGRLKKHLADVRAGKPGAQGKMMREAELIEELTARKRGLKQRDAVPDELFQAAESKRKKLTGRVKEAEEKIRGGLMAGYDFIENVVVEAGGSTKDKIRNAGDFGTKKRAAGRRLAASLETVSIDAAQREVSLSLKMEAPLRAKYGRNWRLSQAWEADAERMASALLKNEPMPSDLKDIHRVWTEINTSLVREAQGDDVDGMRELGLGVWVDRMNVPSKVMPDEFIGAAVSFFGVEKGTKDIGELRGRIIAFDEDDIVVIGQDGGLHMIKPYERFSTRSMIPPDKYFPRHLKREVWDALSRGEGEEYEQIRRFVAAQLAGENYKGSGVLTAKMEAMLKRLDAADYAEADRLLDMLRTVDRISTTEVAGGFARLERERFPFALPLEMYDLRFYEVVQRHIRGSATRLALAREFGHDYLGLSRMIREMGDDRARVMDQVATAMGVRHLTSNQRKVRELVAWSGSIQTTTKLTSGTTAIVQLTQAAGAAGVMGGAPFMEAFLEVTRELPKSKEARHLLAEIRESGTIDNEVTRLMALEDAPPMAAKIAETALTVTGVIPIDSALRRQAAATGLIAAHHAVRRGIKKGAWDANNADTRFLREWMQYTDREMQMLWRNPEILGRGSDKSYEGLFKFKKADELGVPQELLDSAKVDEVAARRREEEIRQGDLLRAKAFAGGVKTQIRARPLDVPQWFAEYPLARELMRFQTFNIGQARLLNYAVKEAIQGNGVPLARMAVLYAGMGWLTYEAKAQLVAWMSDKEKKKLPEETGWALARIMVESGFLGIFGKLVDTPVRMHETGDSIQQTLADGQMGIREGFIPPSVSDARAFVGAAMRFNDTGSIQAAAEHLGRETVVPLRRFLDRLEPDRKAIKEDRRELRERMEAEGFSEGEIDAALDRTHPNPPDRFSTKEYQMYWERRLQYLQEGLSVDAASRNALDDYGWLKAPPKTAREARTAQN